MGDGRDHHHPLFDKILGLTGTSMLRELTPPEGNKCSAAVWYSNVCHDWLVGNLQKRGAWRLRGLSGGVR